MHLNYTFAAQSFGSDPSSEGGDLNAYESPILQLVFSLLQKAHQQGASDIHWEPLEKSFRVRFRIDGQLHEIQQLPKKLHGAVINRLKIMTGSMSIAEKRLPQEGRFRETIDYQVVDFRVSCIPTLHGESIVLRLLETSSLGRDLTELGLWEDDLALLERIIHRPDGLVLVTGPTGSGKTTTLYAILNVLNKRDCKMITVEDPVEYQIPGINQVAVQDTIGRTFSAVLRSMLRQATNIIMVGEIRDSETAGIAINAALTGHLILSTLHTNDAVSALTRLEDLDVPTFLRSEALRAVVAQRLVRRLCPHCKVPTTLSNYEIIALELTPEALTDATPMKAAGCEQCHQRGFQGRFGIFEILICDEESHQDKPKHTLRDDAVRKMLEGWTTPQEVFSATLAV
ncbi:MAG: hypothetical protein A3F67_06260 [Verrucomicrobia bacterium RIFCSPHIGHO2_12_FULL_41_10]|nr:MAG: hypothetical protein A3F67_06260 [Verrucomicrobia bacterium RIFCSPHIGHO2_12_FULL_41_10]HLB33508.1 GspE/PulE family protein [Chthoniobacterales bacterium]